MTKKTNGLWWTRLIGLALILGSIVGTWHLNNYRIDCLANENEKQEDRIDNVEDKQIGTGKDIEYIKEQMKRLEKGQEKILLALETRNRNE